MRFSHEPLEVEARFGLDGSITPLRFSAPGHAHTVTSVGRTWDVADEGRHVLVMDQADRVYELLLAVADLRWYMVRIFDRTEGLA